MRGRKLNQKEIKSLMWLFIFLIPVVLIVKFIESFGIIFFLFLIGIGYWYYDKHKKERIAYLLDKYKSEDIVDMILKKTIWQGETVEQLVDSLGEPKDVESKVLKTKKKEIWKYYSDGVNRYKLRVILENDQVVGWKRR